MLWAVGASRPGGRPWRYGSSSTSAAPWPPCRPGALRQLRQQHQTWDTTQKRHTASAASGSLDPGVGQQSGDAAMVEVGFSRGYVLLRVGATTLPSAIGFSLRMASSGRFRRKRS